jgi:hypothetical protein
MKSPRPSKSKRILLASAFVTDRRLKSAPGQILPLRNVRGMSVISPKAAVNADIFVRPVRANSGHAPSAGGAADVA